LNLKQLLSNVLKNNSDEVADLIVSKGFNLEDEEPKEEQWKLNNKLAQAVEDNDYNLAENLIKQGADAGYFYLMESMLHLAIEHDNYKMVKLLLDSGANENDLNNFGKGSLAVALTNGQYDIANLLIDYGANLVIHDETGDYFPLTDILVAGGRDHNIHESLEKVISAYDYINQSDCEGYTPLSSALESELFDTSELLFKYGADVNGTCRNDSGKPQCSLLEHFSRENNTPAVEWLLNHGAKQHHQLQD
jgi:ankyrin repeat protein